MSVMLEAVLPKTRWNYDREVSRKWLLFCTKIANNPLRDMGCSRFATVS
jgi:hypothetical protein